MFYNVFVFVCTFCLYFHIFFFCVCVVVFPVSFSISGHEMFLRVLQCLFRVFFLIFLFVDVVYLCFLSCRWFTSCNVPFHVRFTMCSLCFSSYAPHRVSGEGWWGWGWGVVGWSKNVHVYLRSGFVGLLDSPGLEHLACGPSPRGYPKGQLVAWGLNCDEVPFGPLDPQF